MSDQDTALPAAFIYRWFAGLFLAPPDATALAAYRGAHGLCCTNALRGFILRIQHDSWCDEQLGPDKLQDHELVVLQ